MHLPPRKVDARTWSNRRVTLAGPHPSFTAQDNKHFFVLVKMIRRSSGRNRSDKLRHLLAANFMIDQHSIPAIRSRQRSAVREFHDRRHLLTSARRRCWSLRTDEANDVRARILDTQSLPGSNVDPRLRSNLISIAVDNDSAI